MATEMSCTRTYPLTVPDAYERVMTVPLEQIFDQRYGPIAPIKGTAEAPERWSESGQSRIVRLTDGGSFREELTRADPPDAFGYTLTAFRGPLKALVSKVDGLWTFAPVGTGTRITWSWTVHPTSPATAPTLRVLAVLWRGYANRAFQRIEDVLVG